MNNKTLANFHRFGHIGKGVMTIIIVLTILTTIILGGVTGVLALFPKDSLQINTTTKTEVVIDATQFDSLKDYIINGYSYATDEMPADILDENGVPISVAVDQDYQTLNVGDQSLTNASIVTDGENIIISGDTAPTSTALSDYTAPLLVMTIMLIVMIVAEFMLRGLFARLAVCDTVFDTTLVNRLRNFGWTLLPIAALSTISGTMINAATRTAGIVNYSIDLDWSSLVAFAITMVAVVILRYGVELQQASDETL